MMILFIYSSGYRAAGNSTFRRIWGKLLPNIVIGRPMTDLCLQCQQNNVAIYRSSNLPEVVKSAKLQKQREHLRLVDQEREIYRQMTSRSKALAQDLSVKLGPNPPCSRDVKIHYSFDYAQQVSSMSE